MATRTASRRTASRRTASRTASASSESARPDGGPMIAPETLRSPASLSDVAIPVSAPVTIDGRTWSGYQAAIFSDVATGEGHTVVRARAGTGKTTTIVQALKSVPSGLSVAFFAFNKSIATELQSRAPAGVQVSTLHSYGFSAVTARFGRVRVDGRKVESMLRDRLGDGKETFELRAMLAKIVGFAKGSLCHDSANLVPMIDGMLDAGQIDWPADASVTMDRVVSEVLSVLDTCSKVNGSIDFDDMVWLPVRLSLGCRQYDRVFIDETQDLNKCQIALSLRACKSGGRICAVGDDRQAIYAFRGADRNALGNVIEALGAKVLPLSITYRCAKSIVEVAKSIVPDYEAADSAPDGSVSSISIEKMRSEAKPGDFVISRANAPLVGLCLGFLRAGVPATVAGRDVGASLVSLVRKSGAKSVADLTAWIDQWAQNEIARLSRRNPIPESAIDQVQDRADCIEAISEGATSVEGVIAKIESLFSDTDDSRRIVCTTTHKAKGLERDRCFVLRDTYRPSRGVEEANLFYVAVTRARSELVFVTK